MPSTFDTYGPFELLPQPGGSRSLKAIWSDARSLKYGVGAQHLRYGIGVYIVADKKDGRYVPLYVGKSDRSFGSRLQNHAVFRNLPHHFSDKSIFIFLVARVTTKRRDIILSKTKYVDEGGEDAQVKRKKWKAIARLEYELIGTCRTINPNLLNFQLKIFQEGLIVPGYVGEDGHPLDDAALRFEICCGLR